MLLPVRSDTSEWLLRARLARSQRVVTVVRAEIDGWLAERRADHAFARFSGHFTALDRVLGRMLDAVAAELDGIDPANSESGSLYERCRAADHRTSLVQRTHRWYADKYDQRLGSAGEVLRAADEVVRSCWTEAFAALDHAAPTGPLVYLDPRFDAAATPRVSVPSDLRAPGDVVIGGFVREMPVPVIALPTLCAAEPWWLVLAAHETGHHVQHDLAPTVVDTARAALADAAGDPFAAFWSAWSMEAFADAFAALTVGPAAAWAVEELQHASPVTLLAPPSLGSRYPPPLVRLALLGELSRAAGADNAGGGATDVLEWLGDHSARHEEVAEHVRLTPRMADALVELPVAGVPLRAVCGWEADLFAEDGHVTAWAVAVTAPHAAIAGRAQRSAARCGIAGGIAAYQRLAARSDVTGIEALRTSLPATLATCGPTGHLATGAAPDLDQLADELATRLLAEPPPDPAGAA